MYAAPGNGLCDFGVPRPDICHFGYSSRIFRRGAVYFLRRSPTLLTLPAVSKSGEMSSAFSLPRRPQPGMKTQRATAGNMNVHISTGERGEGRPRDTRTSRTDSRCCPGRWESGPHRLPWESGTFPGRWMWCLLDLWTADPPRSVARVGKSKPRQTTTRAASDNVFPDLSAVFIDQVSGAADLEKNAVPEQVSCRKESCTARPGHSS